MDRKENYWLSLISRIDLMGHAQVTAMARLSHLLPRIIHPACAALVLYQLLKAAGQPHAAAVAIAMGVAALGLLVFFVGDAVALVAFRFERAFASLMPLVALVVTGSYLLAHGAGWLQGGLYAFGAFLLSYFATRAVFWTVGLAMEFANIPYKLLGAVLSMPVLAIVAGVLNRKLQRDHAAWTAADGSPLVVFGLNGVVALNCGYRYLFVAKASQRMNGGAQTMGVRTYSLQGLPAKPVMRMAYGAVAAKRLRNLIKQLGSQSVSIKPRAPRLAAAGGYAFDDGQPQEWAEQHEFSVNPATGLPTIGGVGSMDVAGNEWGTNHHQA